MTTKNTPPWKRARPSGPRTKLSEHDKERARRRAARAGRRYPNLIDNMWAAQTAKAGEASATPRAAKPRATKTARPTKPRAAKPRATKTATKRRAARST